MGTTVRPRPAAVVVAVSVQLLLAAGFAVLRLAGSEPPLRALEWPGVLAMALVYGLPALLGLLAVAGRPAALLPAATLNLPLAFTALSGISLLLLVPAVCYLVGYARWRPRPPLSAGTLARSVVVVVLGLAAAVALLVWSAGDGDAMYCWSATAGPDGPTTYGPAERRAQGPSGQHSLGLPAGGPAGTVSQQGCSTGIFTPTQAALSLALAAAALAAGLTLPRQPALRAPTTRAP